MGVELYEALARRLAEKIAEREKTEGHLRSQLKKIAEWDPAEASKRVVGRGVKTGSEKAELTDRQEESRRERIRDFLRKVQPVAPANFVIDKTGVRVPCDDWDCRQLAYARDLKRFRIYRRVPAPGWEEEWKEAKLTHDYAKLDAIPSRLIQVQWDLCPLCVIKHTTRRGQVQLIPDHLIPAKARYFTDCKPGPPHGGAGKSVDLWRKDRRSSKEIDPAGRKREDERRGRK